MRRANDHVTYFAQDDAERVAFTRLADAVGATSGANVIRIALWSLADHAGVDMPDGVWDLRTHDKVGVPRGATPPRVPNPRIRQDRPFRRPKPAAAHPWRNKKGVAEATPVIRDSRFANATSPTHPDLPGPAPTSPAASTVPA